MDNLECLHQPNSNQYKHIMFKSSLQNHTNIKAGEKAWINYI
jgi:hypothetical protein